MYPVEIGQSISIELKNIARLGFPHAESWSNINSPFSRIYLFTEGKGQLAIGNDTIKLEAGYIYLIPSFTTCNRLLAILPDMKLPHHDPMVYQTKPWIGMTPCEFIIRKRIEKAQFFILTTDLTQSQIIEKTNFKSVSYFCRIFKKYTNYTPVEYRKQRIHSIYKSMPIQQLNLQSIHQS